MSIESVELPHCQNPRTRESRTRELVPDRRQMLAEKIAPEVAVEVAPHRVDVVAVVLRVVELDDEGRALDAVVVLLSRRHRSRPREGDLLDPRLLVLGLALGGDVRGHL